MRPSFSSLLNPSLSLVISPLESPPSTTLGQGLRVPSFPLIDSEEDDFLHRRPAEIEEMVEDRAQQRQPQKSRPFDLRRFERTAPPRQEEEEEEEGGGGPSEGGLPLGLGEGEGDDDEVPARPRRLPPSFTSAPAAAAPGTTAAIPVGTKGRRTSSSPDLRPRASEAHAKLNAKIRERTEYFLNLDLDKEKDRDKAQPTSSQEDFKSPPKQKKQKVSENSQDRSPPDSSSSTKGARCTICMERFNNGGHRAANLKCGHVFAKR